MKIKNQISENVVSRPDRNAQNDAISLNDAIQFLSERINRNTQNVYFKTLRFENANTPPIPHNVLNGSHGPI